MIMVASQNPATTVITIAVNISFSGGRAAMIANATPCGSTIAALVSPAAASAHRDALVICPN
jgi:hypothetical protein